MDVVILVYILISSATEENFIKRKKEKMKMFNDEVNYNPSVLLYMFSIGNRLEV